MEMPGVVEVGMEIHLASRPLGLVMTKATIRWTCSVSVGRSVGRAGAARSGNPGVPPLVGTKEQALVWSSRNKVTGGAVSVWPPLMAPTAQYFRISTTTLMYTKLTASAGAPRST